MAGRRGPPQRRGPPRRRYPPTQLPPSRDFPDAEELGSKEIEIENKRFLIELKANEQGRFVKILEMQTQGRGRVIFSLETAQQSFRVLLDEFVSEYERLGPESETQESERLKTESFNQGRRRYYIDLRQNSRGRFLKLTMLAGGKTFVAIPGNGLSLFHESFNQLLDEYGSAEYFPPVERRREPPRERDGERERRREAVRERVDRDRGSRGEVRDNREGGTPNPNDQLPSPREVRAGGKTFFFDVERNDRGVFVRLSEVLRASGRRTHINIPNSCWSQIGDVFSSLSQEMPYEDSASGSGSDDN